MSNVEVFEATRTGPNSRKRKQETGYRAPDRIRVAAYVRVSTDDDEQLGSFESQKKYYEEKIKLLERKNKALEDKVSASDALISTQERLIAAKEEVIIAQRQLIAEKNKTIQFLESTQKGN
jgi:predicted RNase H-like nuclease (RuvC/YqgF family)